MSKIRFLCPECSAKLSVESDCVHQFTNCPKCNNSIRAWGAELLDIKFGCSSCGKKMMIDSKAAGCVVDCPSCKTPNKVPVQEPARKAGASIPVPQNTVKPKPAAVGSAAPLLSSEEVTFLVADLD